VCQSESIGRNSAHTIILNLDDKSNVETLVIWQSYTGLSVVKAITALSEQEVGHKLDLLEPARYVMHHQFKHSTILCSAHTVFACFVFFREQTAACAAYTIN
jgi:hypothetical protein